MLFPEPKIYRTWQDWASALIAQFGEQEERQITKLVPYTVASLPPPNEDAMLVFATDEIGGATPVYSSGGEWKRTSDGAKAIADVVVVVPLSAFVLNSNTMTVTTT